MKVFLRCEKFQEIVSLPLFRFPTILKTGLNHSCFHIRPFLVLVQLPRIIENWEKIYLCATIALYKRECISDTPFNLSSTNGQTLRSTLPLPPFRCDHKILIIKNQLQKILWRNQVFVTVKNNVVLNWTLATVWLRKSYRLFTVSVWNLDIQNPKISNIQMLKNWMRDVVS